MKPCEVGILGGGQLARMLAESALRLGLKPIVFTDDADGPASEICVETVVGKISDADQLKSFVARVPLIAFENEFVDCSKLRAATSAPDSKFFPSLKAIEILQDKLEQKKLLKRVGIATSPFVELKTGANASQEIASALKQLASDTVLKWSRQGYDGKGVKVVHAGKADDLAAAIPFVESAWSRGIPVYAEKKVDFIRELAIIACVAVRNDACVAVRGESVTYPLVISEQENGICKEVVGPAIHLGVPAKFQDQAQEAARKIAHEVGLVGSFGIEFFESRSGELLVNEIAPRVHNTGHYTQNAFPVSQFENHWRAILGLPLFDPLKHPAAAAPFFAMLNLLGPAGISCESSKASLPIAGPHSQLHWYGKKDIRPGRKLGHLNGTADSAEGLAELLKELNSCEKQWIEALNMRKD
ncbi:MAG: 5-(carboxyamino)imidazole ribonucleotide synthase [Bdellovibrionia bacterium]